MSTPRKLSFSFFALLVTASMGNAQPAPGVASAPSAPAMVNALPTSGSSVASATEIQKINENMTVLSARLAQVELEAKIAAKQKEINGLAGIPTSGPVGSFTGMPSVVSVAGLKGNLEALLSFPGGIVQRVKAGDVIGDRKVLTIAINEVVLADLSGKKRQRLAFGTSASTKEATPGMPLPFGPLPSGPLSR